jgi:hypothetical protein
MAWPKKLSLQFYLIQGHLFYKLVILFLFFCVVWGALSLRKQGLQVVQMDWVYDDTSRKEFLLVCPVTFCAARVGDRVLVHSQNQDWIRTLKPLESVFSVPIQKGIPLNLSKLNAQQIQDLYPLINAEYKQKLKIIPQYKLDGQVVPLDQLDLFSSQALVQSNQIFNGEIEITTWTPRFDYFWAQAHRAPFSSFVIHKKEIVARVLFRL